MNKRIPTIIGVIILVTGIIAGVYVVARQQGVSFLTRAGPTSQPKQVDMANIDSDTLTVSWTTDANVSGYIKYGETESKLDRTISDDRDQLSGSTELYTTHYVTVRNLSPATTYYFVVGAGSQTYDNAGQPFQVKTASRSPTKPEADTISGKVLLATGQPAPGVIVYVDIEGGARRSALTKNSGVWTIPLATTRTSDLAQYLNYDRVDARLNVTVQGADLGTATATATTGNDSPMPDIALGGTHDFSTATATVSAGPQIGNLIEIRDNKLALAELLMNPGTVVTVINRDGVNHSVTADGGEFDTGVIGGGGNATFTAPLTPGLYAFRDSVNPDNLALKGVITVQSGATQVGQAAGVTPSGFGIEEINLAYEATLSVKLATPIEMGEIIATSSPEIKVQGPVGQKVTITVNSEPQTQEVTIGADGTVDWTPPEGLEPGGHTLTIEYTDANGILQKITRSFTVLAAEPAGLPSFTASPSATPTASPTAAPRVSMPSTEAGVPQPGVLNLTIAILMLGVGLFLAGIIWQIGLAKRYSN